MLLLSNASMERCEEFGLQLSSSPAEKMQAGTGPTGRFYFSPKKYASLILGCQ
jgi:hypothetical protein